MRREAKKVDPLRMKAEDFDRMMREALGVAPEPKPPAATKRKRQQSKKPAK